MNLKITREFEDSKTISGGSVANSIVGLSQLGNKTGFIGKVNDDDLGRKYSEGLKRKLTFTTPLKRKKSLLGHA